MKINQLIAELTALAETPILPGETTCDTIKTGDGNAEIKKVAVSMFATPDVIRRAAAYGANFLIVHEPTFYTHYDIDRPYPQACEKEAFAASHDMTIYRFHDHPHRMAPDMIYEGQIQFSGLAGRYEKGRFFGVNRLILDTPMTTLELVKTLEENLGVRHLRIAGSRDNPVKTVSCCFGTPGNLIEEFEECDTVLTGEICEWNVGEYVRDRMQLKGEKSMVVMGHINSEKFGMKLLTERLAKTHPELAPLYIDCGDLYSYTDD